MKSRVLPDQKLLTEMGKFNEELVNAGVNRSQGDEYSKVIKDGDAEALINKFFDNPSVA